MATDAKPWYQSKTVWVNILMLVGSLGAGELGIPIPPEWAVPLVAIANLGVRLITGEPIALKRKPTSAP